MNIQQLNEVLIELRSASIQINHLSTEEEIKSVMNKYAINFLGEKLNAIYSYELRNSLEKYFGINLTLDALNELIPKACSSLNIEYNPQFKVEDLPNQVLYSYEMVLW